MKIIDRYVSRQLLVTGLLALSVLSVVLVLANILKQLLGLLINHDAPVELVFAIVAYILGESWTDPPRAVRTRNVGMVFHFSFSPAVL